MLLYDQQQQPAIKSAPKARPPNKAVYSWGAGVSSSGTYNYNSWDDTEITIKILMSMISSPPQEALFPFFSSSLRPPDCGWWRQWRTKSNRSMTWIRSSKSMMIFLLQFKCRRYMLNVDRKLHKRTLATGNLRIPVVILCFLQHPNFLPCCATETRKS